MRIRQIRNATLKIVYGGITFLLDLWLQNRRTGFSALAVRPEMKGVKSPLNALPMSPEEVLNGVDYCLVTHIHPDHFTEHYLPKNIKIMVQNDTDCKKAKAFGFENVSVIADNGTKTGIVTIMKTPSAHGDNEQVVVRMGETSGYLLTGEDKSLYIAGDTVFYSGVAETLNRFAPDVIIVNCCEATAPDGRLVMNLHDVECVCGLCPEATVIATHLDSVNHALLTSGDIRQFAFDNHLNQVVVPCNGEWIQK